MYFDKHKSLWLFLLIVNIYICDDGAICPPALPLLAVMSSPNIILLLYYFSTHGIRWCYDLYTANSIKVVLCKL